MANQLATTILDGWEETRSEMRTFYDGVVQARLCRRSRAIDEIECGDFLAGLDFWYCIQNGRSDFRLCVSENRVFMLQRIESLLWISGRSMG